jgi:hypothetical protein
VNAIKSNGRRPNHEFYRLGGMTLFARNAYPRSKIGEAMKQIYRIV